MSQPPNTIIVLFPFEKHAESKFSMDLSYWILSSKKKSNMFFDCLFPYMRFTEIDHNDQIIRSSNNGDFIYYSSLHFGYDQGNDLKILS